MGCAPATFNRKALSRPPSKIATEIPDQYPFGFYRNVKPVFRQNLSALPYQTGKGLQKMDYVSVVGPPTSKGSMIKLLNRDDMGFSLPSSQGCTIYMHQGSRTLPGRFGALESRMGKALFKDATHQRAIKNGTINLQTSGK